jgi:hypothetical protein
MQIEIKNPIYEKAKAHFEKHKLIYCCIGAGLIGAGITTFVMKNQRSLGWVTSPGESAAGLLAKDSIVGSMLVST